MIPRTPVHHDSTLIIPKSTFIHGTISKGYSTNGMCEGACFFLPFSIIEGKHRDKSIPPTSGPKAPSLHHSTLVSSAPNIFLFLGKTGNYSKILVVTSSSSQIKRIGRGTTKKK